MSRSMGITRSKNSRKFAASQQPLRAACSNAVEQLEKRLLFTTVTVTNALSSGAGSLHDAILAVNGSTDQSNTINFNLASDGSVQNIPVNSALPAIKDAMGVSGKTVLIDGTSEPGYVSSPLVQLVGPGTGNLIGLEVDMPGTVQGLAIFGFTGNSVTNGFGLHMGAGSDGSVVQNNVLGDAAGFGANGNQVGLVIDSNNDSIVDNLISGNIGDGIDVNAVSGIHIGGTTVGSRNIIVGNGGDGISFFNSVASFVQGNSIGIDASGNALGDAGEGVMVTGGANIQIGGSAPGAGNVISAIEGNGIKIQDSTNDTVAGNFIGTNADGTSADPSFQNVGTGVFVLDSPNVVIGGPTAASRNIISNEFGNGVHIDADTSTGDVVQNNYIGTDVTGTVAIPNSGDGVDAWGSNIEILSNVISASFGVGIDISGNTVPSGDNNLVEGNFIGTDPNGHAFANSGNQGDGILVAGDKNQIVSNTIAFNGGSGVGITTAPGAAQPGTQNTVQQNSIFSNAYLGIDLNDDGLVTSGFNPSNPFDAMANNDVSFPVLNNSVQNDGTHLTVSFTLPNALPGTYTVDFYSNADDTSSADPSLDGYGEGKTWLGSATITVSDPSATFSTMVNVAPAGQALLSATVTDSTDGTSEFAADVSIPPATVTTIHTGTTVTSSANPSVLSQPVTFTATVTPDSGAVPAGDTVTFFDQTDNSVLGTVPTNAGVASITVFGLDQGDHTIVATFNGDSTFLTSNASLDQHVSPAASMTTLTSSLNPSTYGQLVIFSATLTPVSPAMGTPTGSVEFFDGTTDLGGAMVINGVATFDDSALSAGTHAINAVYEGDSTFLGSGATLSQIVTQASANETLSSSVNPSVFGQMVTFTAAVNSNAGNPSGSVTLLEGTQVVGATETLVNGVATWQINSLGVGDNLLHFVYSGDTNFAGASSANLDQIVTAAQTLTTITSMLQPVVIGQSVTFTAQVTVTGPGSGTPDGTVNFYDGTTFIGSGTLSGGFASVTSSSLNVGDNEITAHYVGTANFLPSISQAVDQSVGQDQTKTGLTSSANPSIFGSSVTFVATVVNISPIIGMPTGSVSFYEDSNLLQVVPLDSNDMASINVSGMSVGNHQIQAFYSGDADFAGSSYALTQTVVQAASATSLSSSANPSVNGQSVILTAAVTGSASAVPSGSVVFFDGTTQIGSAVLDATGHASISTSGFAIGSHALSVSYLGDNNYTGSSASLNQQVNKVNTMVALTSSADPSVVGQSVTFTATVSLVGAGSSPLNGTITFLDGGTAVVTANVTNGVATWTTTSLTAGTHSITAAFSGNTTANASTSAPLSQVVNSMSTISGAVYKDLTGDGFTPDDTLMSGVTVQLFSDKNHNGTLDSGDGAAIASMVTKANGAFSFGNLAPGEYFVQEITPSGFVRTLPTVSSFYTINATAGSSSTGNNFDNFQVSCQCTQSSITTNFNAGSSSVAPGNYLWFSAVFKPQIPGSGGATIIVGGGTIKLTLANGTTISAATPNAIIHLSRTATVATTSFDPVTNAWVTTLPASGTSGNDFLDGFAFQIPPGVSGSAIKSATWTTSFMTDTPGVSLNWQFAAAVYNSHFVDSGYNGLGVKASDDNHATPFGNSDHAGTPEEELTEFLGNGGTGGGGSNFTGSYSSTASVTPCVEM